MAKIKVTGSGKADGEIGFRPYPDGMYLFEVLAVKSEKKQREDGSESLSIQVKSKINAVDEGMDDDAVGKQYTEFYHIPENADAEHFSVRKWKNLVDACELKVERDSVDEDDLVGSSFWALLETQKGTTYKDKRTGQEKVGNDRNQIKECFPE